MVFKVFEMVLRASRLGGTRHDESGGGGLGWGTHVNPWLIHVNGWQKPLQYCKVISLQLIKINGKKKKERKWRGKTSDKATGGQFWRWTVLEVAVAWRLMQILDDLDDRSK